MTTDTRVDWSTAQKTEAAKNSKPGTHVRFEHCVRVPRAVFATYWPLPFSEVVAASLRGDDGLEPWVCVYGIDKAPADHAYLHAHEPSKAPERTCLYSQGR